MRRLYAERNWKRLKDECVHLTQTARSFGFQNIAEIAHQVELAIPEGKVSRATNLSMAREEAEKLFSAIDTLVTTQLKGAIL
jgi:HPt (histidine-containing phosphotransfer) domain-containing protein